METVRPHGVYELFAISAPLFLAGCLVQVASVMSAFRIDFVFTELRVWTTQIEVGKGASPAFYYRRSLQRSGLG